MKEKTADNIEGHRIKVGLEQHKSSSGSAKAPTPSESTSRNSDSKEASGKNPLLAASNNRTNSSGGCSNNNNPNATNNNFDDDYNEWDISIGDLIIDLDADIERQSEGDKTSTDCPKSENKTVVEVNKVAPPNPNPKLFSNISDPVSVMSSNLKSNRLSSLPTSANSASAHSSLNASSSSPSLTPTTNNNSPSTNGASNSTSSGPPTILHHHHGHNQRNSYSMAANSNPNATNNITAKPGTTPSSGMIEHHATVEKGLKMKIKRKNIGGKISETKHEIVSSDISPQGCKQMIKPPFEASSPLAAVTTTANNVVNPVHSQPNAASNTSTNPVITANHSNTEGAANAALGEMSASKSSKHSNKNKSAHRDKKDKNKVEKGDKEKAAIPPSTCTTKTKPVTTEGSQDSAGSSFILSSQSGIPNLTLKYSSTLSPTVIIKPDEANKSVPPCNAATSNPKKIKIDNIDENISESRSVGTSTSISTITEPECLGPCEPGTSVTLEGIVWQETEGGVLVVNVTWRGKTYVGTLLDCTKHDWAPPRFCESPTSDIESKSLKNTRGKRARNSFAADTSIDTRSVTSKLRNGKGRRTANSGYVPASPAKSDSSINSSKRKGRPGDLDLSSLDDATKRNRVSKPDTPDLQAPTSPVLIECPEPNCSKKYKHINGLKYHQSHAHIGSSFNINYSQDFDNANLDPNAKDDASDSELNESSTPDFATKDLLNYPENVQAESKCDHTDTTSKMDAKQVLFQNDSPTTTNNSANSDPKKLSNSANDLVSENPTQMSSIKSVDLNAAEAQSDKAVTCDDISTEDMLPKRNTEKVNTTEFNLKDATDVRTTESVSCVAREHPSTSSPSIDTEKVALDAAKPKLWAPSCSKIGITGKTEMDDIENVASPAYSDISDDTNTNDNSTNNELSIQHLASTQSLEKSDLPVELKKSQLPNSFSLSSYPPFFNQPQFLNPPPNLADIKANDGCARASPNDRNESHLDVSPDKPPPPPQNPYSYPFYRFGPASHDSKSLPENVPKPNTTNPTNLNKMESDTLHKDKAPESTKIPPPPPPPPPPAPPSKEGGSGNGEFNTCKQPILELQNLKNRIQSYAFDQVPLYDNQKRFFSPDCEKADKSKERLKHSPQKPPTCKEEKVDKSVPVTRIDEGVKPTMETTGPPPPPTNGYYYNPSFLPHSFPSISPFDNSLSIFRNAIGNSAMNHMMGPPFGPPPGASFLHHPQMRFHPPPPPPPPPMSSLEAMPSMPSNSVPRCSISSSSSGPTISTTSAKPTSHHPIPSSSYNPSSKPDRGGILSPPSSSNSSCIPSSSHSMMISSSPASFHKSPNKEFAGQFNAANHNVPVSSDQRTAMAAAAASASLHQPRHPFNSAYPIFDPYSAMIVNHAANPVPMHPFTPK